MEFGFSAEQEEFRRSLRRLLAERAPSEAVRKTAFGDGPGVDTAVWQTLTEQLGLPSLHIPESDGGAGFTLLEAAVAMEELGRALTPVPYAASLLASVAVLQLGSAEQRAELLPDLASGEKVGALAVSEPGARRWDAVGLRAAPRGNDVTLTGTKTQVLSGPSADILLVAALGDTGSGADDVALHVLNVSDPGVTLRAVDTLDPTRPMATVELDGAAAVPLAGGGGSWAGVVDVARALLAAEMVGVAERCLEMTVAYAKDRMQFNRPIGSFQAVKHGCADMAVELDAARSAAMFAVMCAAEGSPELSVAAPLAKAEAADALTFCAGRTLQLHGGIGFTWEHDAHLYLRRAKTDEVLFGSPAEQREVLATRVGI